MTKPITSAQLFNISAVERETGLSKDALRMWERRYAFPQPERDRFGERVYPLEQVEKLRLVKCLLDQGHRPGKVIGLSVDKLRSLAQEHTHVAVRNADNTEARDALLHYIALCKDHRFDVLRRELSQILLRLGLHRFVVDVIAPLTVLVGEEWANGRFAVFEEHLYTESVQVVMRNAIAAIPVMHPDSSVQPRILLTTFPQEQHSLGLLMAEAIFAIEGAYCISLGVQTPVMDIVRAAQSQSANIVALSFSASMNPNHVLEGLANLRSALPRSIEVWAGGRCPVLRRRPPDDVLILDLEEIHDVLAEWRSRQTI